jgi:hypothetical protein
MERKTIIAWLSAGMGIAGGGIGYGVGDIIVRTDTAAQAEAKQCIVEWKRPSTSNHIPEACKQLIQDSESRGNSRPTIKDIEEDYATPAINNPHELRKGYAGYGILGGLVLGFFLGREATYPSAPLGQRRQPPS